MVRGAWPRLVAASTLGRQHDGPLGFGEAGATASTIGSQQDGAILRARRSVAGALRVMRSASNANTHR
jgi:hypothetical protein